jgi:hypothetical protein
MRLNRLCFHQTRIDTAIVAREVDKGTGLVALLEWAGIPVTETIAIGDSEPDLPMFQAARRSFAPAQISCPRPARMLGCTIARRPYQAGLREIVRSLTHPSGRRCRRCRSGPAWPSRPDLFTQLLRTADQSKPILFLKALLDPRAFEALLGG